jgi:hypothetical protein
MDQPSFGLRNASQRNSIDSSAFSIRGIEPKVKTIPPDLVVVVQASKMTRAPLGLGDTPGGHDV